ncbi:divergent PAP2 family protein [Helicovermis profundi]|uniref:Divergent PAP2 family protein n=1 Tax=Helicovermis profundi TaxID=3065157 RepID=A0AAU9EHL9_9FIRM|nr:divergent PAP2 family protein [Clostridia bacterium S502]
MNFFEGIIINPAFQVAFCAWLIAQILKVFTNLYKYKKLDLYRLIGSGGMPSSHSSFVMGLSTAVGLIDGWDSSIYAISLVFALIVMYDASGVRRSVGKQAIIINHIITDFYKTHQIKEEKLKELVGHTPFEVFAGAILGIIFANLMI